MLLIDDGAGHRLRSLSEQEERKPGDVLRLKQPAEWLLRRRFVEPPFPISERDRLHVTFGRRIDPADVDRIGPDAVIAMRVRRVLRQGRERGLGRALHRELRRAAVSVHREDVDDRAGRLAAAQVIDEPLHEKEGRAGVHRVELVPKRQIRIEDRSAIREAGRIDERIDPPELFYREVEDHVQRTRALEIRLDECADRASALDGLYGGRGFAGVPSDDDDRLGALGSGACRDRQTDALGCACD